MTASAFVAYEQMHKKCTYQSTKKLEKLEKLELPNNSIFNSDTPPANPINSTSTSPRTHARSRSQRGQGQNIVGSKVGSSGNGNNNNSNNSNNNNNSNRPIGVGTANVTDAAASGTRSVQDGHLTSQLFACLPNTRPPLLFSCGM